MPSSGPLQVIPPGLLGFFNLKSLGQNPSMLDDLVSPTIELREWYMQAQMIDYVNATGLTMTKTRTTISPVGFLTWDLVGGVVPGLVPDNEWWWVENYTIYAQVPAVAGEGCTWSCAYISPSGGAIQVYQTGLERGHSATAAQATRPSCFARQFWVPPGATLGLNLMANTSAGGITYQGAVRLARLRN